MVWAKKYVVKRFFDGVPKRNDFEVIEYELPPLQDDEILLKVEWVSVDPYHRVYNNLQKVFPYDQFGFQVGTVTDSKNEEYPVGTKVVTHKGWCTHTIVNPKDDPVDFNVVYKLPPMQGLSDSLAVGTIGMTGATACIGFLELCNPKPGETVVVTGAAGAVGSLVGQIAKIKGCKVIGFTGSDLKVKWLKELGFDAAFNYKTVNAQTALKEAAPNGIDCYFDNVGGELSSIIINQMNQRGRVSICGSISSYNDNVKKMPKATILQPAIVSKELEVKGFLVVRWIGRWSEAFVELVQWIKDGKIQAREHVTEGFENIFDAFIGMLSGESLGKAVIKI